MKNMFGIGCAAMLLVACVTPGFADEKEGTIAHRKERQQDRIAAGVKNGSLSPKETANLENKEVRVNKEVRTDRAANGGKLTGKEKAQVNRQQNRISRDISKEKHDAQTQPK